MSRIHSDVTSRTYSRAEKALDRAVRVVPVAVLVALGALFTAQQAVSPQHRAIKSVVLLGLMALMLRFDMVYSVYLFAVLFVFPSGVSFGSTNNVLMTIIPLIWAVRATSSRMPLLRRTVLDAPIALFILAFVVALVNVNDPLTLARSLRVIWTQVSACAFFYCITMFVNDEEKLIRFGKVVSVSCFLVMSTAVLELFAPGSTIIPGWIRLARQFGEGEFTHRVEGIRVGGAFESHGMLADFGTQLLFFMVFFALTARGVIEKTFWVLAVGTTLIAILGTANRGAMLGFGVGLLLVLLSFYHRIGLLRGMLVAGGVVAGVVLVDAVISEKTIAVSVFERFGETRFEGVVPDTRTMTWKPALIGGLEKPYFGHGPYYDTGVGLTKRYWPHNGYLFFFYTLGLFGLGAFLWVIWRVYRETRVRHHAAVRSTRLGNLLALARIWLLVLLVEQLRTDHQRDDIYPYIVWMCFGVVVTAATIARERIRAANPAAHLPGASKRSVVSTKS